MIEIIIGLFIVLAVGGAISTYRIVPQSEADLVTTGSTSFIASSDETIGVGEETKPVKAYFGIPSWVPFIGTQVRRMDVTIKELTVVQDTFEKNQARFSIETSTKWRIKDIRTAAQKFTRDEEVEEMLRGVVTSSVRDVTSKVDVIEARSNKQGMEESIKKVMGNTLSAWGLELVNFQVVDLKDTSDSKIITNISLRREKEIESETRQQNAERIKLARVKEAESDELAKQREIERDQRIAEQIQIKDKKVSEQEKLAQEQHYEVVRTQEIKQAEIAKQKAIIQAEQRRETEVINKQQKQLEGEGDRLKQEEQAKGDAASIRENGIAEAQALDRKQEALNKFTPGAITALTAEQIVEANKQIGIETAKALSDADVKVFAGGNEGKAGFKLAELLGSMQSGNPNVAGAFLNKIARSNDLGFTPGPILKEEDKKD